jgi:ABC-type multidrug transport system fused ATPase/permease subunit
MIVLIENGRIAEMGSHNELINKRGIYWRMIDSQSLDLIEDDEAVPTEPAS